MLLGLTGVGLLAIFWLERRDPSVRSAVVVGVVVRLAVFAAVVATAQGLYLDVGLWFHQTGQAVLAGHDPATHLDGRVWNYLPAMPLLWAAGIAAHMPWPLVARLWPMLADIALVPLIAALAPSHRGRRAMQYAVCPLAVTVAVYHGQLEPIMLALVVGALLVAGRRPVVGGGLLGLAVAVKSWPVLCALAVWRTSRWWSTLLAAASVLAGFAAVSVVGLHAEPLRLGRALLGYSSYPGQWGWTGLLRAVTGHELPPTWLVTVGKVVMVGALAWVGWRWRRVDPVTQLAALLLVFVALTPGWGMQYALWPVPFMLARPTRAGLAYIACAAVATVSNYAGMSVMVMVWLSLPTIAAALWVLRSYDRQRRPAAPATRPTGVELRGLHEAVGVH